MKTMMVEACEVVDGKKVKVAEGELLHVESLEDIILGSESGEWTEKDIVAHFNASRRIEFQRQLKSKDKTGTTAKAKFNKLVAAAAKDDELAQKMREMGLID